MACSKLSNAYCSRATHYYVANLIWEESTNKDSDLPVLLCDVVGSNGSGGGGGGGHRRPGRKSRRSRTTTQHVLCNNTSKVDKQPRDGRYVL